MSNYIPSFYVAHILIVIVVLFFVLDATKNVTPNCNFSTIQMNTTLTTACVFYFYNRHFLQRLPSRYRGCCNKNLVSVCMLKQNIGGVSRGFTNMKSNRNISKSDPEMNCSTHSQDEQFSRKYQKGALCLSQAGRMCYPA